jgi:ribosomal protein L12E/L44/L45/RPP1/RPP2
VGFATGADTAAIDDDAEAAGEVGEQEEKEEKKKEKKKKKKKRGLKEFGLFFIVR